MQLRRLFVGLIIASLVLWSIVVLSQPYNPDRTSTFEFFFSGYYIDDESAEDIIWLQRDLPDGFVYVTSFSVGAATEGVQRQGAFRDVPLALRTRVENAPPHYRSVSAEHVMLRRHVSLFDDISLRKMLSEECASAGFPPLVCEMIEGGNLYHTRVLWGNMVYVALEYVGLGLAAVLAFIIILRAIKSVNVEDRREQGHCIHCGYDLRGRPTCDVCPECGQSPSSQT